MVEVGVGRLVAGISNPLCLLQALSGIGLGKVIVASVILRVTGHGRITFVTRRLAFQSVYGFNGFATHRYRVEQSRKTCLMERDPSRFDNFFSFISDTKPRGDKRAIVGKARPA